MGKDQPKNPLSLLLKSLQICGTKPVFLILDYTDPTNLALGKSAHQSDTVNGHEASLAVDGNADTCSITEDEGLTFWDVELGGQYQVAEVVIDNSGDCCCRFCLRDITYIFASKDA